MTTLDFFNSKLNLNASKKLIIFEEKDKNIVRNESEIIRFSSNGLFSVEKKARYAFK